MKTRNFILYLMLLIMGTFSSAYGEKNTNSKIKEETVTYTVGGTVFRGFIAYDENRKGKRPAVLVVPEWWGLNDYPKMRARKLAELGYIALAVDMFGDGKIAVTPTEAQTYTAPFYSNPQLSKVRLDAAIDKIKEYKQTDPANIFAIGYCFGGSVVLNSAKLGSNLKGVVSFHGGLKGVPADKDLLKARILVCHGASDKFVPESDVTAFRHQLDSIGAIYTFIAYPNATHAFTNPASTETGRKFNMPIKYNKQADQDSWNDMKKFFASIILK
ncbi:MAG: dienelactone hydrolase family protein [Bacteroidota bacterium]|nr:dienelactone hydrolase family protein [Bacteroidota bacterium]